MKIGLFTDAYYPIISGVSISVDTLSKELTKLGHEVVIVTNDHDLANFDKNVIRFEGKRLPMKGLREYRIGKVTNKKINDIGNLKFDLIHCHTEFTMGRLGRRAAKRFNIPVVHTYHTMYEDYVHFVTKMFALPLRFLAKKYSKWFANSADEVIFPTIKVKKTFDRYGFEKTSHIIPTGIYLEKFRRINYKKNDSVELGKKLGIEVDDFVLLYLGRMSKEKSIDEIIVKFAQICEKNTKVKLLLVGGGPDQKYFEDLVQELNLSNKVIFTGMIVPTEVGSYYQIADLFVNFSVTETQGLTYIEALASGVPLLVKYDDNLEGVIENGVNGFAFKDNLDFVPLFNKIYTNQVLFNEITNNASRGIEKFSAENYAINVLKIYNKLLI
ncbi:MAG: glycosyltransferase family 4 protein [Firmicutes bacterium]|nr:glycosyltransferase family 4 protein [Bacillota bacterium]